MSSSPRLTQSQKDMVYRLGMEGEKLSTIGALVGCCPACVCRHLRRLGIQSIRTAKRIELYAAGHWNANERAPAGTHPRQEWPEPFEVKPITEDRLLLRLQAGLR